MDCTVISKGGQANRCGCGCSCGCCNRHHTPSWSLCGPCCCCRGGQGCCGWHGWLQGNQAPHGTHREHGDVDRREGGKGCGTECTQCTMLAGCSLTRKKDGEALPVLLRACQKDRGWCVFDGCPEFRSKFAFVAKFKRQSTKPFHDHHQPSSPASSSSVGKSHQSYKERGPITHRQYQQQQQQQP